MTKTATKTANSMSRAYIQSLLEEKGFVYRSNFQFEQPEKFKEHLIKISLFVPTTDPQKAKTFEEIKLALEMADIKHRSEERFKHVYIKYEDIIVPTSFIEKMQNDVVSPTRVKIENIIVKKDDEFAPVLKIVKEYGFKAFEKSRNSDSITFVLPDQTMVESFTEILDSFEYKHTTQAVLKLKEVTVFQNRAKTAEDIVVISGFKPANLKRFSQSLESSLSIVFWEIAKNKMPANQIAGEVSANPNRSTRFSMLPTRANEQWVTNFAKMMNDVYGVDIDQPADKHTFFVVSKGDPGHTTTTAEKVARQRDHFSSRHEVTQYLIDKGFNRKNSERPDMVGFQLHLKDGLPDWIETCYGEESDRKAMAFGIHEALKVFVKHKNYKLDGFGAKKATTVVFKKVFRKGLDPVSIILVEGGFKQFNNKKPEVCGFVLSRLKGNKKIVFNGGTEDKRILDSSKAAKFAEEKMPNSTIQLSGISSFWIKPKNDNVVKEVVEDLVGNEQLKPKLTETKLGITKVAATLGIKNWSQKNIEEGIICFSRSTLNKKTGWQPVSLMSNDKTTEGNKKVLSVKNVLMEALTRVGHFVKINREKPDATSFHIFVPTPERPVPEDYELKVSNPVEEAAVRPDVEKPKPDPLVDVIRKAMLSDLVTNKDFQDASLEVLLTARPEAFSKGLDKKNIIDTYMGELRKFLDEKVQDVLGKKVFLYEDIDALSNAFVKAIEKTQS